VDVVARQSPSFWLSEVNFIIRNQVHNIVLIRGICYILKGKKDGELSATILPKNKAAMRVKGLLLSGGIIESCLVYELIDQRNESEPLMEDHQVFIAVRVFVIPLINKCGVSAAIFMARKDQFSGSKDDMKQLQKSILQNHMINNTSFECVIKTQTLKLDVAFHSGKASVVITLKETDIITNKSPILY
jgi:hypothetical protein